MHTVSPLPEAIRAELAQLRAHMDTGFQAVTLRQDDTNEHLKELNGRTRKAEDTLARHDERIKTLFRSSRHRDSDPIGDDHRHERADLPTGERRITERDVKIVIATVSITATVAIVVWKVFPLLLKALQP